jgi:hypothetical protein
MFLVLGDDFVIYPFEYKGVRNDDYLRTYNDTIIQCYKQSFSRQADLVGEISLEFNKMIDRSKLKIFLMTHEKKELFIDENFKISDFVNYYYNLLCHPYDEFSLLLEYNDNNLEFNPYDSLVIKCKYMLINQNERKILMIKRHDNDEILSLNDIENIITDRQINNVTNEHIDDNKMIDI